MAAPLKPTDNPETDFLSATTFVRQFNSQLEPNTLLLLYGRYKQAKEGKCNESKPGFFDFRGKAKWDAWNQLGDMSQKQAMSDYVSILSEVIPDWQSKAMKAAENNPSTERDSDEGSEQGRKQGLGVAVSVLAKTENELMEDEKTVYDWCKEGNVEKVKDIISKGQAKVNGLDEDGLSLLHWASDRGFKGMVEMLLSMNADINVLDVDRQTPLHYAVSCEHSDVIQVLIQRGIDQTLEDSEGSTALDMASDDMKLFIKQLSTS